MDGQIRKHGEKTMTADDRPRRSALYLPASNARAIEKARGLPADIVILDLEDAVAPDAKPAAREAAVAAVREGGFGQREVAIRANGLDTPWGADDLAAIAASGADAVLVPKISSPTDIAACEAALKDAPPAMQLWAMIETCAAALNLEAIAAMAGSTRLSLWIMGVNDLAKEMRARQLPGRVPFQPVLTQAVCAARAHGLVILDGVCNEFRDLAVFRAEAEQGLDWGFDGKTLIHPAQLDIANAAFAPSEAEIDLARRQIAAFDEVTAKGGGVAVVDGKIVENLHIVTAKATLAKAEAIAAMAE